VQEDTRAELQRACRDAYFAYLRGGVYRCRMVEVGVQALLHGASEADVVRLAGTSEDAPVSELLRAFRAAAPTLGVRLPARGEERGWIARVADDAENRLGADVPPRDSMRRLRDNVMVVTANLRASGGGDGCTSLGRVCDRLDEFVAERIEDYPAWLRALQRAASRLTGSERSRQASSQMATEMVQLIASSSYAAIDPQTLVACKALAQDSERLRASCSPRRLR